jgi:periplasmic protein TonB
MAPPERRRWISGPLLAIGAADWRKRVDYAQQQRNPGKHTIGLGIVIALHVLLGWAIVSGLARKVVDVIKAPIETKIIEEVQPPPEVVVNNPPPAPAITVTREAPPPAAVTIGPPPAPAAPPAPPAPPAPKRAPTPFIGNAGECAPKSEDYPPAAARAQATGTTVMRFTIGADGKMTNAEVVRSAGSSREHRLLDRLAIQKFSECTFKPGLDENGKPVGGVMNVEFVWKLD